LAILAAIAIPALTGYIDKAEQRAAIADVREMHTALQAMVMQDYADKRLVLNGGDPNREIHYYGNSSNASSVTIGGKDYYNVYIEYGRGDSSNASPSFPHLLAYLGADAPPGLPADCNYAQLRFLVALDGSIAALDYVTYNNNKSGKIPKTRITWNYNGADANISEVVLKNYLNHIDDSGYVVRYFNGKLISGVKPN
jgi:type II secretory pathway pseudopilin PulG